MSKIWEEHQRWDLPHFKFQTTIRATYWTCEEDKDNYILTRNVFFTEHPAYFSYEVQQDKPEMVKEWKKTLLNTCRDEHLKNIIDVLTKYKIVRDEWVQQQFPKIKVGSQIIYSKTF